MIPVTAGELRCGTKKKSPWSYRDVGLPTHSCQWMLFRHKMEHVAISSTDTEDVQPRS